MHGHNNNILRVAETGFFTTVGWVINKLDLSYADSALIAPVQHLLSIVSLVIGITAGLPLAYKVVVNIYSTIKNFISKWKN